MLKNLHPNLPVYFILLLFTSFCKIPTKYECQDQMLSAFSNARHSWGCLKDTQTFICKSWSLEVLCGSPRPPAAEQSFVIDCRTGQYGTPLYWTLLPNTATEGMGEGRNCWVGNPLMLVGEEGKKSLRGSDHVQLCQPWPQHRASFWPRRSGGKSPSDLLLIVILAFPVFSASPFPGVHFRYPWPETCE